MTRDRHKPPRSAIHAALLRFCLRPIQMLSQNSPFACELPPRLRLAGEIVRQTGKRSKGAVTRTSSDSNGSTPCHI